MAQERVIMASVFKQHCLALLDRVAEGDLTILVTKYGKPVARVSAVEEPEIRPTMGSVTLLTERDEELYSSGDPWDAEDE